MTNELTVTALHPGVTRDQVQANTAWALRFAPELSVTEPPTTAELRVLRDLVKRTARAHGIVSA